MFDVSLYNIIVRKGNFDGEVFFEAKVKELPDVAEYADSYEEAYLLAIDSLETTAEALAEQGKVMPSPILENDDFSGRGFICDKSKAACSKLIGSFNNTYWRRR